MAIESFYISIELTEEEKGKIQNETVFQRYKKWTNDLLYENALYIDNVDNEEGCWWHINACYFNFFDSCTVLYELCLLINTIKPKFEFTVVGGKTKFDFISFIDFLKYIYEKVEFYKHNFNDKFGKLLVVPGLNFYKFRRKTKKYFIKN